MIVLALQALNFFADPVVYQSTVTLQDSMTLQTSSQEIYYLEFNCAIPYQELFYEEINDTITAKLQISFKLVNVVHTDSIMDQLFRQFTIPSFSQAAREEMVFVVQFGLYAPAGEFDYSIEMTSGDKKGISQDRILIDKHAYAMSDILLANSITKDSIGAYLTKGDLKIIPHPSHVFSEDYKVLYVYYEIYNIKPDAGMLQINYLITDSLGKTVRKISRTIKKEYKTQAVNLGLNIEGLAAGKYLFAAEINDSAAGRLAAKQVPFEIRVKPKQTIVMEDLPHYEEIEYFLSPDEYKYFRSLSGEGKGVYLKKFWEKHDYGDIAERFESADGQYREGVKLGSKTDRGRIFIKFGQPDEVERSTIEIEVSRPYEHWQYYNGTEFIFVDIRGTNEYTLIWTNAPNEKKQPTLYQYLPSSIREEIEGQ